MSRIKFKSKNIEFLSIYCFLVWLLIALGFTNCRKFVTIGPPISALVGDNVYTTDATAAAVLTGILSGLSGTVARDFSVKPSLSADELTLFYTGDINSLLFYTNSLTNQQNLTFWELLYNLLANVNTALEGVTTSATLTPAVKQELIGEAKFLRAFFNFYLVNYYGDVPLVITSDYRTNSVLGRSPKSAVYEQIIADLKDASKMLSDNYVSADAFTSTMERVRPNKWAAKALLSRVYLFTGDWLNCETEADSIINNATLFSLSSLDSVFLKNSSEAIWQIQPTRAGYNTEDANIFDLPSTGPSSADDSYPVYLSSQLLNSFEMEDQRKSSWVDSVVQGSTAYYFPYKYKATVASGPATEYNMVFRLGEQYLIRAEARAERNDLSGAQSDLSVIRRRAGLQTDTLSDMTSMLEAIFHERQVELFTEWGHRWLDLKRTQIIDSVMNVVTRLKGGSWRPSDQLYPLPLYDLQQDENLNQNPGY